VGASVSRLVAILLGLLLLVTAATASAERPRPGTPARPPPKVAAAPPKPAAAQPAAPKKGAGPWLKTTLTPRQARRQVMRDAGIPTSQQPVAQQRTAGGRQYTYHVARPDNPRTVMSVQESLTDRVADHGPHWEAGPIKGAGQVDPLGRPRLKNGKAKVDQ
jgi:uncharacterized iron-regulated membrane protein